MGGARCICTDGEQLGIMGAGNLRVQVGRWVRTQRTGILPHPGFPGSFVRWKDGWVSVCG